MNEPLYSYSYSFIELNFISEEYKYVDWAWETIWWVYVSIYQDVWTKPLTFQKMNCVV